MKKIITLVAAMMLFAAGTAGATTFDINLSGFYGGMGTYTDIDRITVSGTSTLNQSFGSDGIFNNGDTFSEMSLLQTLTYWSSAGDYNSFDQLNGKKLYVYANNLSGSVYNVNASSANPADWMFDYVFNPGQAVYLYADTDTNPTNGVQTVAEFITVNPSGGQGPAGFLGGAGVNGTTDMTALFGPSTPAGVWSVSGTDILDYIAPIALLNTHNTVIGFSPIFGDTQTGMAGFSAQITSNGELRVVTPEPGTFVLLGAGLLGLGIFGRRRMKK